MRILRVIARLNVGGPARHVVLLDSGLRARGFETLLVHGSVSPGEADFEQLGRDAGLPMLHIPELGRRISAFADVKAFAALLRAIWRYRPDVVHTHTAKAGALGRSAAWLYNRTRRRSRRCAVVHTFHGHVLAGYFGRGATALVRAAERLFAHATDRIITISAKQQREIVNDFRIAPLARTTVIELGLDLHALVAQPPGPGLRPQLAIPADAIVVGYVGRFVPIKDLSTLVDAFAAARKTAPKLWLMMAGDGPVRDDIEARVRAVGIADVVRFVGWTDALGPLYQTMDLCALSSRNEGTPVALIEAMATGLPVVATNVGGVADVVENGRTGLLVPPADADELGRAIARLARDAALRRAMGAAGRIAVASRFTQQRLVSDIDSLYQSVLRERRGLALPRPTSTTVSGPVGVGPSGRV